MRESAEKPPPRSRGSKILKFLPKATSFSVPNQPYSPGRDKGHHRGFSGPMISIVPAEARRNPSAGRGGYQTPEPTSPKVSCIGQIKHKKKKKAAAVASRARAPLPPPSRAPEKKQQPRITIGRLFSGKGRRDEKPPVPPARAAAPAPALGQLRRFASGRDALANFDWRASRVADDSGEEDPEYFYEEDSDDEVFIPHSAPILVGGGGGGGGGGHVAVEPRKEVNIWKRRTMAPPRPLHLE